jgi:redox-sensitive bicupin YhaK (pirin superfamily)
MSLQIIRKNQQAAGQFNGGEILENKPIGFPREGGHLHPFSNLFYWAHAWSDKGSTIGLHPHQGFEIMSFVIKGSIEHYDTGDKEWKKLEEGAAQIIRSGSGIAHSEKLNPGAHMFQIWFDPNLNMTLQKAASYSDYPLEVFPRRKSEGEETITYVGDDSPLQMDADIVIVLKEFTKKEASLSLAEDRIHAIYLVSGKLEIEGELLQADDFFIVRESKELRFETSETSSLFIVSVPEKLDYPTYAESLRT